MATEPVAYIIVVLESGKHFVVEEGIHYQIMHNYDRVDTKNRMRWLEHTLTWLTSREIVRNE